jgi:putative aldouronate transport system permease protein
MNKRKNKINAYDIVINLILILVAMICLLPFIHVLAVSLSNSVEVMKGAVLFWPKEFTLISYVYIIRRVTFWKTFGVSVKRVILGVSLNFIIAILTAFPISRSKDQFKYRSFFTWYLFITMIFNGGMIPNYMVIKETRLINSIFALVIPTSVRVFGILVLYNFFKNVPSEIDDAADLDGASPWTLLFRIYLPISLPALATIVLFFTVYHWNSWFDGILYMNRIEKMPLQSYLQTILIKEDISQLEDITDYKIIMETNNQTLKSAQIVVACIPVMALYPFLQKYFIKGIMLGSVKG